MLVISSEKMLAHDPGPGRPECPERLRVAVRALERLEGVAWEEARPATVEELSRVHDADYIAKILALRGECVELDEDTHTSPGSVDAALLSAGAAIEAATAAVRTSGVAVSLGRPPGHHAERAAAMGFCLFNNVAVAAAHARAMLGCERVLVVDWDVHHGNGTEHIFEARRDVLFVSLHEFPLYPGTGAHTDVGTGDGAGFNVNVPFAAGHGDADYAHAFREVIAKIADPFRPDLVLISAGFDGHAADPLAGMQLTEEGYAFMTDALLGVARRHAHGRIGVVLEGGYDLDAMGKSLRATLDVLAGKRSARELPVPTETGRATVRDVCAVLSRYWSL